jgi:hypothetical protein
MTRAETPSWGSEEGVEQIQLASALLHLAYALGSGRVLSVVARDSLVRLLPRQA